MTRDLAIFDAYAGLRRIGYTRDGAFDGLQLLGVSAAEASAAARRYHGEGDRCGDTLDMGSATTQCTLVTGHDGAHHNGQRRWS